MEKSITYQTIAIIHSDYDEKFGIPRQSGLCTEQIAYLVFEPEYRDENALRGLQNFSHLWLIWRFSESEKPPLSTNRMNPHSESSNNKNNQPTVNWSPMVRPPRLGGNKRLGVFSTRSPFRPNPIGLSCVQLVSIDKNKSWGTFLTIRGADLMNGTPILDIKPYLPYADSHPEAIGGDFEEAPSPTLDVSFPTNFFDVFPIDKKEALLQTLSYDPRPSYQSSESKEYGIHYAGYNIRFKIEDTHLTVISAEKA